MKNLLPFFFIILSTACLSQTASPTPTTTQAPPTLTPTQTPLPSPTPKPWLLENGLLLVLDENGGYMELGQGVAEIVEREEQLIALNDFGRALFYFEDGTWAEVKLYGAYDIEGWRQSAISYVERFYPEEAARLKTEGADGQAYFDLAREKLAASDHLYNQTNPHSVPSGKPYSSGLEISMPQAEFRVVTKPGVMIGVREVSLDNWIGEHSGGEVGVVVDIMRTDETMPIPARVGKIGMNGELIPFIQLVNDTKYDSHWEGDRMAIFDMADIEAGIGELVLAEGPYYYVGHHGETNPEDWNVDLFWYDWNREFGLAGGQNWEMDAAEFESEGNFLEWFYYNLFGPFGKEELAYPWIGDAGHYDAMQPIMREKGYIGLPIWLLRFVKPSE